MRAVGRLGTALRQRSGAGTDVLHYEAMRVRGPARGFSTGRGRGQGGRGGGRGGGRADGRGGGAPLTRPPIVSVLEQKDRMRKVTRSRGMKDMWRAAVKKAKIKSKSAVPDTIAHAKASASEPRDPWIRRAEVHAL